MNSKFLQTNKVDGTFLITEKGRLKFLYSQVAHGARCYLAARPQLMRRFGMQRRRFIAAATLGLAGGALAGCAARLAGGEPAGAAIDATAFHASRRYAPTRFGRIAYVERGSGDAALFLHGFPLNSFQWRGALERLSGHRRCIAPDFMAMGYTEVAEGQSVAPEAQAAMLVTLLDTLSLPSVDLVANDSGGAVAQLLVTRHPQRFRTLLLTNCDAENDSPPAAFLPVIEMSKAGKFVDEWLAKWRADKALARSADGIGGMWLRGPGPSDRRGDRVLLRAARELLAAQSTRACLCYRAGAQSPRGHRAGAARLQGADADPVGYGRHDLLRREPRLSRPDVRQFAAAQHIQLGFLQGSGHL